jgi:hypothetical protein
LRAAANGGWLGPLIEAHLTPCSQEEARRLLGLADCRHLPVRFGNRRGRFYRPFRSRRGLKGREALIALPGLPGFRFGFLRVGIVLHEAAHALDWRKTSALNHQRTFQQEFRSLLRKLMTTSTPLNFRQIYDRHQGPYVLLLLREDAKGKQFTDRITGSALRAQAAHEKALDLINDRDPLKTDVQNVFVFSDTEGQFTGALYKRGEEYAAWEHLAIDDAPPVSTIVKKPKRTLTIKEAVALADDAQVEDMPTNRPPGAGRAGTMETEDVPTPPKVRPTKLPGDRFPVMRGRPLVHVPEGEWPKSAPAQFVKSYFGQQPTDYSATSAELVAAIGPSLIEIGVQFPASLISRLKQAGLLKEKTHESQKPEGDAQGISSPEAAS